MRHAPNENVTIVTDAHWDNRVQLHIMAGAIWNHETHVATTSSVVFNLTPQEVRALCADLLSLAEEIEKKAAA